MDARFACPPDCGWCCTHLTREERPGEAEFRDALREEGVYHCRDAIGLGLSLAPTEAAALQAEAASRGLRVDIHPRTFLLESRRRLAVVLDWHMPYEACPFYASYQCTAYELRPLVCRAYPVMAGAPAWQLAPACPKSEPATAARALGNVRFGSFLKVESVARRAIDEQAATADDVAMTLLASPRHRFARGLAPAEAARRAARWRTVAPNALEA